MKNNLITVPVEDIRDWAFCPIRVWWRRSGLTQENISKNGRYTGQFLLRKCIDTTIKGCYQLQPTGSAKALGPEEIVAAIWARWLKGWDLAPLADPLMQYYQQRQSMLDKFGERGQVRDSNGNLIGRPMLSRQWIEHAVTGGLLPLRRVIDAQQGKAGLGYIKLPDDQVYSGPMGLADAFADSMMIASRLKDNLPPAGRVIGQGVPLTVDLLSVRLASVADLVMDEGAAKRGRGRPTADAPEPPRALSYEIFLYDDELPLPHILARDIRLMAMMQSRPADVDPAHSIVSAVRVRHLKSGQVQELAPHSGGYTDVLESLARAYVKGVRAGLYVPRMILGWEACNGCDYRSICYADNTDVLSMYNPPLEAQIQSAQPISAELRAILNSNGIQAARKTRDTLRRFLQWMESSPGVTPESAEWMLDNLLGPDSSGAQNG